MLLDHQNIWHRIFSHIYSVAPPKSHGFCRAYQDINIKWPLNTIFNFLSSTRTVFRKTAGRYFGFFLSFRAVFFCGRIYQKHEKTWSSNSGSFCGRLVVQSLGIIGSGGWKSTIMNYFSCFFSKTIPRVGQKKSNTFGCL